MGVRIKALRLFCKCGAVRLFSGYDTDAVLASIDAAGWQEVSDDRRFVRGEGGGRCPVCAGDGEAAPEFREAVR